MLPSPEYLKKNPHLLPESVKKSIELARQRRELQAFITLFDERAAQSAGSVRDRLLAGENLPLGGWIVAIKDNIAIKDERLTCASHMLENFTSRFSATAVERLEAAGAVVVGKTNLDEFAMGSSSENTIFGPVHNPNDIRRVAGGSSGGSAVAVAARIVHAALGSDTGGSVRQPAAFCGIVGLKPTYGRISRYGLVAFGSSLDQIGIFAEDCSHAYRMLCVMAGVDPRDSSSSSEPPPELEGGMPKPARSPRIGIPKEYFIDGLAPEISSAIRMAVEKLRHGGCEIVDVSLPFTEFAVPVYYIIATAEASSNLARFDGVRYGWRNPVADEVSAVYDLTRSTGFGDEVKRRIMMGTFVLSAGYFDAYYRKAQQVRRFILDDFVAAFAKVDVLLTPTTPTTAFRLGEKIDDPLEMYLSDIYTVSASLAGLPAVSLPISRDSNGLPIGLQLIGPHFSERRVLGIGRLVEETAEEAMRGI